MFTRISLTMVLLSLLPALAAQPLYQPLGQPASDLSDKPEWNLTISPDGQGLPAGSGTASQGKHIFEQHCAACHGFGAIGGSAMPLVGEVGSLASEYPEKTVNSYWPFATTLFDYIRRSMPPSAPFSLNSNEIYALCAYILSQDGIIEADVELNAVTLPQVTMPNRNGFSATYPQ
ncbi:cytochrome c [Methylophaga sp.]|uniref:c-type cytochrome n=1 Tax=Methylophaga sp. TaxID=2024840 RepID=UPI00140024C4|nr:cytochrome c [Methylophaga sp.]MTI63324.1 cytochrome c [Methylophaga sp.]